MGNAQPNTASAASAASSSTIASSKYASLPTNGHSHSHSHSQPQHGKQPTSPPYSLTYYSDALTQQDLSPSFFLSSPLLSPRPPVSSSPSFDLIAYADIARLLLSSNPTLSLWRYKLVPARISEYLFWRCLFLQLDAQHPDCIAYQQQALQLQQRQEQHAHERGSGTAAVYAQQPQTQTEPSTGTTTATAASEREIESLKLQILSLQQQITDLQSQLQQATSTTQHPLPPAAVTTTGAPSSIHRGRWQPDKNTLEFFALDESLRSTLREQKERRLGEVRREMRWIVDGERVEDGPGRWECCGKEEWNSEGCKR